MNKSLVVGHWDLAVDVQVVGDQACMADGGGTGLQVVEACGSRPRHGCWIAWQAWALFEKLRARCSTDCRDGWVGDSPLVRDCVETLDDAINYSNRPRMILAPYLSLDDRWDWKETGTGLAKRLQKSAVLELADNPRPNLILSEPIIKLPA